MTQRTRLRPSGRTRAARYRSGKALRKKLPRSAQGRWKPPKNRPGVVDLIEESNRGRVKALLPIRMARMASSSFGFLRGAAANMACDLSTTPVTGLRVQLGGDAHVGNFGVFATPERDLVFDENDFDETLGGPWEFDLKRLATSLVLVGREGRFERRTVRRAVLEAVAAYRTEVHALAQMRYLDAWYVHLDLSEVARVLERQSERLLARETVRARGRTGFHAFPKLTDREKGAVRIRETPPFVEHYRSHPEEEAVRSLFSSYRSELPQDRRALFDRYRLVDVAENVVGVGSVGTRCSIGLFMGDDDLLDPLFLQAKEAVASVHERYLGPSPYRQHGERVVVGQRMIQEASDIFLGASAFGDRTYYVRQLRDMKIASDVMTLAPRSLLGQAQLCGAALGRAHARTGDAAALAGYLGEGEAIDRAVLEFAESVRPSDGGGSCRVPPGDPEGSPSRSRAPGLNRRVAPSPRNLRTAQTAPKAVFPTRRDLYVLDGGSQIAGSGRGVRAPWSGGADIRQ